MPQRPTFTIGQVMLFIGALAVPLAALVVKESAVLALIAFFIITQLILRLLIVMLPSLGSIFLGTGGRREPSEDDVARIREGTRTAMTHCAAGRYAEALDDLLVVESLQSGDAWNAIAQAWCLRNLGRLDDSLEPLERTAHHVPFDPLLQYVRACHWSLAGHIPRALDALSMAVELDPELRDCAAEEPDLDAIRKEADFLTLVYGPEGVT